MLLSLATQDPQDLPPADDRFTAALERIADALERGAGAAPAAEEETAAIAIDPELDHLTEIPTSLEGLKEWGRTAFDKLLEFLPSLAAAVAILFVGWLVARVVRRIVSRSMLRGKIDATLANFVASCAYMALMAFVVVSAISKLGVNTASFVAILGAASFAVGFAMQGSLANFASGVMMMIFRPLRVGDLVEAGGVHGVVKEVGVFATVIDTLENKKVIVANSSITDGNIVNYTANGALRVDMTFGIGYGDDMDLAMRLMLDVLGKDERVLKNPAPTVACKAHGSSSVDFVCRPYVKPAHYWAVWFDTHKKVKEAFDANGVSIPFPQRDVHLIQADA